MILNFIKYHRRKKELIDTELAVYKQEQINKMELEFNQKRIQLTHKINVLAQECARQTAEYEHTFHADKEKKGILLAELGSRIVNSEDKINYLTEIINMKEVALKEIELSPLVANERERLYGIIDKLLEKK